jgi:hypothetical protein
LAFVVVCHGHVLKDDLVELLLADVAHCFQVSELSVFGCEWMIGESFNAPLILVLCNTQLSDVHFELRDFLLRRLGRF